MVQFANTLDDLYMDNSKTHFVQCLLHILKRFWSGNIFKIEFSGGKYLELCIGKLQRGTLQSNHENSRNRKFFERFEKYFLLKFVLW